MSQPGSALLPTYARSEFAFERGEGAWLYDTAGDRYLDFAAGIAVNVVGHSNPHVVDALKAQADKLWHVSNLYRIPEQERLAARLTGATFADRVFFTNSGTEAIECAIKMARRHHWANGRKDRYRVITFEGAFHGRTLAAIAAGGQEKYLEGFGPPVSGFDQVPFGDHDAVKRAITLETAAIMIEPVQGEGGIRAVPPEQLRRLRDLCDEQGLLLIFDEIQCGLGRTGTLFAHEQAGAPPDIMAVAKALGAGFPVGACLATEDAASGMTVGTHGSTYGGNPMAMTVGNAVLDILLEPDFLPHVRDMALRLRQGLAAIVDQFPSVFSEMRGSGLMLGLKCVVPNKDVIAALRGHKLLCVGAGDNVVRLLPPLTVSEDEVTDALARIEAAASEITRAGTPAAAVRG